MVTNPTTSTAEPAKRKRAKASAAVRERDAVVAWLPRERSAFVIDHLGGVRAVAALIGVSPSQPSRWRSGQETPGPDAARLLVDLDHVLATLLQVWAPEVASDWLQSPNAHLDSARPIDVLRVRGSAEVVAAARAEAAGAYA